MAQALASTTNKNRNLISGTEAIVSLIIAVVLSPVAALAPHTVIIVAAIATAASMIFVAIEQMKEHRNRIENQLQRGAAALFIIAGILCCVCSVAAA